MKPFLGTGAALRGFARPPVCPDGLWVLRCLQFSKLLECTIQRDVLCVADTRSGVRTRVAYGDIVAGPVAFAPDGKSLVYRAGGDGAFYVVNVP